MTPKGTGAPVDRGMFDIYQTRSGYTAVDNETHRNMLEALASGDKQLPELVDTTGRTKPTLSVAMRDLLNRQLVEELPHPTDKRRKIYRLIGTRIGASDIPVPQLRRAVESYVSLAPLQGMIPVQQVLAILAAAPAAAPRHVLEAQARHLGQAAAQRLRAPDARQLWMRVVGWLEEEGLAQAVRLDLERGAVELQPQVPGPHMAVLVGGMVDGIFQALELADGGRIEGDAVDGTWRLRRV